MTIARWILLSAIVSPLAAGSTVFAQCPPAPGKPPTPPAGGNYNGPGDTVPSPTQPGPATPGPTGPTGPGAPGPRGPATGRPSGPAAPAPRGPSTSLPTIQVDDSSWSHWWNFNRDPYLDLKRHVLDSAVLSGSDEFFLGRGQQSVKASRYPDDDIKRMTIGPALQAAVEDGSWRVKSHAMRAIAKLHPVYQPQGKSMLELISQNLSASNQEVVESAIIALGITGDIACIQVLGDIAADNEAGRELLQRTSVPGRWRPLAALSMGTLGPRLKNEDARRMVVGRLSAILAKDEGASPDLHIACVTSMGMTALPEEGTPRAAGVSRRMIASENLEAQTAFVLGLLQDKKRHEYVRAHVPKALALLTDEASKELRDEVKQALLVELKRHRRKDRLVRYGLVEALGMLGDADAEQVDADVREALHASVRDGDNNQRGLSLVAIALASSRGGESDDPFAALPEERAYLLKQLSGGKSRLRSWTALSLGLQGYHATRAGNRPSNSVFEALLATYKKTSSPADAGAWSIGMGLFGDPRAEEELVERLEKAGDDEARGYAAVGLGLLRSREAIKDLESLVAKSTFHPITLRKASIGLALLGEKSIVPALLEALAEGNSAAVKSTSITALALVGDERVVDPLVEMLEDDSQLDVTRGYSSTVLGVVCETAPLPWTAHFANHVNYYAMPDSILSPDRTGILSMR